MTEPNPKSSQDPNTPSPAAYDPNSPASDAQRRLLIEYGVDPPAANDPRVTKRQAKEWLDGFKERRTAKATPQSPPEEPQMAPDFVTADKLGKPAEAPKPAAQEAELVVPDSAHPPSLFLVEPEINIQDSIRLWQAFDQFRAAILDNESCYDVIEGSKEMNRTGAMRLAMPFGLSIQQIDYEEGRVEVDEPAPGEPPYDYRYRVRIRVGKGQRWVEGIVSCRLSEISATTREKGKPGDKDYRPGKPVPMGQREHFASTKAWTRASKRAIADLLGGTEAD